MYRLIVESLLGLHLEVDKLRITPCLPPDWTDFRIHYRYRQTFYHIAIHNQGAEFSDCCLTLDGVELTTDFIQLVDDGRDHDVEVGMLARELATEPK